MTFVFRKASGQDSTVFMLSLAMLEKIYRDTALRYTDDFRLAGQHWLEIVARYADPQRQYHNFQHLEQMYSELEAVQQQAEDWDTLFFALIYHDVVYNPHRGDNEEESALLALQHLRLLPYPEDGRERCTRHIMATRTHVASADGDTNLLTDADLSILGQEWPSYERYVAGVRREYSHVPETSFRLGRKGLMQRFLSRERIYHTAYFYQKYESKARENISKELDL